MPLSPSASLLRTLQPTLSVSHPLSTKSRERALHNHCPTFTVAELNKIHKILKMWFLPQCKNPFAHLPLGIPHSLTLLVFFLIPVCSHLLQNLLHCLEIFSQFTTILVLRP